MEVDIVDALRGVLILKVGEVEGVGIDIVQLGVEEAGRIGMIQGPVENRIAMVMVHIGSKPMREANGLWWW